MAIRTNYLFRIAVNCTLGVALILPFAVYLCGGADWTDNDTLEYTSFNNVNWVWVAILTLWSAIAFQYLSIVGRHKPVLRLCLFLLSAWGGFIAVAGLTAVFLAVTGTPATVSGPTLGMLEIGGALLGCTLWLEANGLSWFTIA